MGTRHTSDDKSMSKLKQPFLSFFCRSRLTEEARLRLPEGRQAMYERVWDESDYVIPPSENNAFFVMTNVVLTPNQTRTVCPEDPTELPKIICGHRNATSGEANITNGVCVKGHVGSLLKSHGEATGNCVLSDRKGMENTFVCEIKGMVLAGKSKIFKVIAFVEICII